MAAIKKVVAKKPLVKKPLAKKQAGGSSKTTPFKDYLKSNKGSVPSDTVATSTWDRGRDKKSIKIDGPDNGPLDIKAKNPKNQKALESAYEKTYGQDIKSRYSNPSKGETHDQYNRRMGYKKGGAVKKAVIKKTVVVKKKK